MRKYYFILVCGMVFCLSGVMLRAETIYLKNGSSLEGKIIQEDKTSVTIEISTGTITIKRGNIAEIIKAGPPEEKIEIEPEPEAVKPRIEIPKAITPTIDKSSRPVTPTTKEQILVLSDEGKTPAQKEINALLRKLVDLKESESPWELVEKLVVKSKGEADYLTQLLKSVQNRSAVKWLIYALGQLQPKGVVNLFYEMLGKETDETIRITLVEALGQIKGISTANLLRKQLLAEKSNTVKATIINQMSRVNDVESLPVLVGILESDDESVRKASALAIMSIYSNADSALLEEMNFISMLKNMAAGASVIAKGEIIGILGAMKNRDTADVLLGMLGDESADVRSKAVIALAAFQDDKILEILTTKLNDEKDLWTRMQIVQSMGTTNNESMIPVLIELLQDEEEKVRLCAARSLSQLTHKFLGDRYDAWKEWWDTKQGSNQ